MSDSNEEPERKRLPPGPGRPLGSLNQITHEIKEALVNGALYSDYAKAGNKDDPNAPGTLTQYCISVANRHPELYFQAITKLVPKQIQTHLQQDTTIVSFHSTADVIRAMELEGMTPRQIKSIKSMLPMPLEQDEEEQT